MCRLQNLFNIRILFFVSESLVGNAYIIRKDSFFSTYEDTDPSNDSAFLRFQKLIQVTSSFLPVRIMNNFMKPLSQRDSKTFVSNFLSFISFDTFFDDGLDCLMQRRIFLFQVFHEYSREYEKSLFVNFYFPFRRCSTAKRWYR